MIRQTKEAKIMKKTIIIVTFAIATMFIGFGTAAKADESVQLKKADCNNFTAQDSAEFGACVKYVSQSADKDDSYTSVVTIEKYGCQSAENGENAYETENNGIIALAIPEKDDDEGVMITPARCFIQSAPGTPATTQATTPAPQTTPAISQTTPAPKKESVLKKALPVVAVAALLYVVSKNSGHNDRRGDNHGYDNHNNHGSNGDGGYHNQNQQWSPGSLSNCTGECMQHTNDADHCACECQGVCRNH